MPWDRGLTLRHYDVDYLGHVTAAAYLTFFEEARVAWLMETWDTRFPAYVVARQELLYEREVLLEDSPLTISVSLVRLGERSFDVEESMLTVAGDLRSRSRATLVAWNREERHSRPVTETERAAMAAQLEPSPADWPERASAP